MIKFVQLFGERCSGTNFLSSLINKNFDSVIQTKDFGGKHWYIKDHYPRCRANQSTDYQCVRSLNESDDTLFVVLFRNPFDWLRSIQATPYHAWQHSGLDFSAFIRKPWISSESSRVNLDWPDSAEGYWFIEEAENILRLRAMKIWHLRNLQEVVKHVCYINYEVLRDYNELIEKIGNSYGIRLQHPSVRVEGRHFGPGTTVKTAYKPKQYAAIAKSDLAFIAEELDWELEGELGYRLSDYNSS